MPRTIWSGGVITFGLALARSSRVAVAKWAWHGRKRLGLLWVRDDLLVLHLMRRPDEIRDHEVAPSQVSQQEIEGARRKTARSLAVAAIAVSALPLAGSLAAEAAGSPGSGGVVALDGVINANGSGGMSAREADPPGRPVSVHKSDHCTVWCVSLYNGTSRSLKMGGDPGSAWVSPGRWSDGERPWLRDVDRVSVPRGCTVWFRGSSYHGPTTMRVHGWTPYVWLHGSC
ncbi:hypothetical protein [Streptomyces sp. MK5]|uniref:hypothetical protein n=1 Tax=Streptomyces sp. MK5 TaxID=3064253 RepID=UPI002742163F|nr:hypothetical protein [Streptomyces sp. MK5]